MQCCHPLNRSHSFHLSCQIRCVSQELLWGINTELFSSEAAVWHVTSGREDCLLHYVTRGDTVTNRVSQRLDSRCADGVVSQIFTRVNNGDSFWLTRPYCAHKRSGTGCVPVRTGLSQPPQWHSAEARREQVFLTERRVIVLLINMVFQ